MIGVERDRLVGDGLAFGTLNCTGPAFVAGGPSLLLPRAGIGGPGQEIFVERAGAATVIFFRRSQWQGDTCAPTSQENRSGRPADSEIQLNVTAPFNVE